MSYLRALGSFSNAKDEDIVHKPETTPGGRALKFGSSVRMSVRRGDIIKRNNEQVGL